MWLVRPKIPRRIAGLLRSSVVFGGGAASRVTSCMAMAGSYTSFADACGFIGHRHGVCFAWGWFSCLTHNLPANTLSPVTSPNGIHTYVVARAASAWRHRDPPAAKRATRHTVSSRAWRPHPDPALPSSHCFLNACSSCWQQLSSFSEIVAGAAPCERTRLTRFTSVYMGPSGTRLCVLLDRAHA